MATPKMSLKLLVDKKGERVLFGEATKEFVDFLFDIFSLPLGTLIELLGSKQMVGCLGKLKESVDSCSQTYLQLGIHKDDIFNPKTAFNPNFFLLSYVAPADHQTATSKTLYRCSGTASSYEIYCRKYVTEYANAKCPSCYGLMNVKMTSVVPERESAAKKRNLKGGYVKEAVTYMVMDDLVVKPMSTISSITLMAKSDVKNLSQLEEKVVSFGKHEALLLLKASLMTDKVLTTVFFPYLGTIF